MDVDVLTIGFARRAAAYKRADLLFRDLERLQAIAGKRRTVPDRSTPGKAHPHDERGQGAHPARSSRRGQQLGAPRSGSPTSRTTTWSWAKLMTAGVDVWLNTPQPPLEASGTSGMKAALNGVPSLEHPRRLVDRGLHRGRHRLGHRRNHDGRAESDDDRADDAAVALRQAREQ